MDAVRLCESSAYRESEIMPVDALPKPFDEYLETLKRPHLPRIVIWITEWMSESLETDSHDIGSLCDYLEMSKRTVQRRLKSAGTGYAELRDKFRFQRSMELLSSAEWSVEQIAERLGYGDRTSFTAAFKRWTGIAPNEYRSRLRKCTR